MKGITIAEECHVVNATPPVDINGAGASSDVFSLENYAHATIICQLGVTGAAATITVEECDDFVPSDSAAIAFDHYAEETPGGDTLDARASASVAGITISTEDSIMYVIEIDASQLTDGYPNLRVVVSDPAAATLFSCLVILSGSRFAGSPDSQSPSAIA
jgi:hypothetical protein